MIARPPRPQVQPWLAAVGGQWNHETIAAEPQVGPTDRQGGRTRRTCLVVGVVATAVIVARLDAQSPPDFSGKWVLASSQAPRLQALGEDFSIAQDATTLRVDSTGRSGRFSNNGPTSETRYPVRTIYILDGIEHPSQVIASPPLTTASAPMSAMTMMMEESISKATWAGRQLVIMTYSRMKTTVLWLTPSVYMTRRTGRQAFSMDADGTLVVENLIVNDPDPLPGAHEAPSPTLARTIYKKG
jgi:hypothetical protein